MVKAKEAMPSEAAPKPIAVGFDIRTVDPRSLNSSAYNPRKISEQDFANLCRSIREFGFVDPICVQASTNSIIGGHQRARAAIVIGLTQIPATYLEIDDNRAKALNIALNRVKGDFDVPKLQSVLADLDLAGIDLGLTGFTKEEIAKFDTPIETAEIREMNLRAAPSLVWVLVGVPINKFADVQPHIAALETHAEISVQSSRDS